MSISKVAVRIGVLAAIIIVLLLAFPTIGGYMLREVGDSEIGVVMVRNQVQKVVGPGFYSEPFSWFADLSTVSVQGIDFCVEDTEVLIKNAEQRIGVRVCGRIRRPGVEFDYRSNWAQFSTLYRTDQAIVGERDQLTFLTNGGVVYAIASQSMKVCVGDRTFEQSVVGGGRDDLRLCMDTEMSKLAETYGGLQIDNVTVPNVVISQAAQQRMDEITQSRLQADLSRKQADQAKAEGERQLAEQQAQIMVSQGRLQEEQRQKAITASLEREALEAQTAVIQAQKANELAAAQADLDIAKANRAAAEQQAAANLAPKLAEAQMYGANPAYVQLLINQYYANAYSKMDKIVVPAGSDVNTILGGGGSVPWLNVGGQPAQVPGQ